MKAAELRALLDAHDDLHDLREALRREPADATRAALLAELDRVLDYRNADEWNRAVRLCEALAVVGWGEREPVEAARGKFLNGNPMTGFYNRLGEPRFVDAIWSRRQGGWTLEPGRTSYHASPDAPDAPTVLWEHPVEEDVRDVALATQRNWIPKAPVRVRRAIANCYESMKATVASLDEDLSPSLLREMRPEAYGSSFQRLNVTCSFSYFDGPYNKCNYVVFDEAKPLKKAELERRLKAACSAGEISERGYFARNKIELGRFSKDSATYSATVHFDAGVAELSPTAQRERVATDLTRAVEAAADKLRKKLVDYDLDAMVGDFERIARAWAAP